MPNKQGFTLVEVIISIALIAILSVGFVYLTSGSMRMLQVNKVQHDTYQSFVSAVEEGQIPAGATEQVQNTVTLQLSNHNTDEKAPTPEPDPGFTLELEEVEISYPDEPVRGSFIYYQ